MKQVTDKFTFYSFEKPARDRLRQLNAKSSAQRLREFRQRKKFNFLNYVTRNEKSCGAFDD